MSPPPNAANVNPKDCVYGCNTRIYWNTITSEYWELLTKKKHVCQIGQAITINLFQQQQHILTITPHQNQHITITTIRMVITAITITRNQGLQSLTTNNRWIILWK